MRPILFSLFALFLLCISTSCEKEKISENIDQLEFSVNPLFFDTVFTSIGTATRNFKVYNRGKGTLRISSIALARENSQFRINVDGLSGKSFTDVDILPNDSIFVFVEATINPNGINTPLIVTDSILFNINGKQKDLDLVAWGQDANYFFPDTVIQGLPPLTIISENTVWNNTKPYVIYGYTVVDENFSLTIEAGTKIHFHSGGGLWIYKGASIKVLGTKSQPVIFQGDRLESTYKDTPGQWDRIWINEGSVNNVINYAIIKNALIGLQMETLPFPDNINAPTSSNKLILTNTIIQNCSGFGIYARNYRIDAQNVLVANAGQYCMGVTGGGEYKFTHATFANYFSEGVRSTPAFFMTNRYKIGSDAPQDRVIENSQFTNCIFYGSEKDEFGVEIFPTVQPSNIIFQNCLMRREEPLGASAFTTYQDIILNKDPLFKNRFELDFTILENSPARDVGAIFPEVLLDLNENRRDDGKPDLGTYEYKP